VAVVVVTVVVEPKERGEGGGTVTKAWTVTDATAQRHNDKVLVVQRRIIFFTCAEKRGSRVSVKYEIDCDQRGERNKEKKTLLYGGGLVVPHVRFAQKTIGLGMNAG
jgi:hypothetical protein